MNLKNGKNLKKITFSMNGNKLGMLIVPLNLHLYLMLGVNKRRKGKSKKK